jgi:hypothetical protein
MTAPILLDAGSSGKWGWHGIQSFNECPQKFSYRHNLGIVTPPKEPLVKGSILHVGLAHRYARMWAQQNGELADRFYSPEEAMTIVAHKKESGEIGPRVLPEIVAAMRAYEAYYAAERVKVLEVEQVFECEIGGEPYTQRLDWVYEDPQGRVWLVDHKTTGRMESKTAMGYAMSGQILGMRHLGRLYYGERFAGVKLNMIVWGPGGKEKFARLDPEPAPFAQSQFTNVVTFARDRVRALRESGAGGVDPMAWPRALSETTCVGRYGACEYYDHCKWGK